MLMRAFRKCGNGLPRWMSHIADGWPGQSIIGQTVGMALAVTAASLLLFPLIGTELMPESDSGDFMVSVKMPIGTALSQTDKAVRKVEGIVMRDPNVQTVMRPPGRRAAWEARAARPDPTKAR